MLKKIDHINIVVKDIGEAKDFFLKLGFIVEIETILEGKWIDTLTGLKNVKAEHVGLSLKGKETKLELLTFIYPETLSESSNGVINKTGLRHLAFEVDDIEKMVDELQEQGIQFFSDIQRYDPTKKKLCYLQGPEGIVVELAEYKK